MPAHMHPRRFSFACWLDISWNIASPGSTSRHESTRCPPCTESPFAPLGCYPSRGGVCRHLERHYPFLIAHTGSCARPTPSRSLLPRLSLVGLCRLLPAPAGRWSFPTLSPQVSPQVPGPLPRWDPMVHSPVSSHRTAAFPTYLLGRLPQRTVERLHYGSLFRGCSHSAMFRPPGLLITQVAPTAVSWRDWAAVTFTSEHLTARYLAVPRIC